MARKFETSYAAAVFKYILDAVTWDRVVKDLDARVADVEDLKPSIENAIENVTQVGVSRINDVLTPAIQSILQITAKGFLIAHSSTPFSLAAPNIYSFIVPVGAERDLFTPSPFCTVSRLANYTDYAFVRTISYTKETGQYVAQVVAVSSAFGLQSDWVISAGTGVSQAVQNILANTEAARAAAQASATSADTNARATAADRIATGQDRAKTASDVIASQTAARLAATFDPTTYQRTTFNIARFSATDLNLTNGQTVFPIPTGYTVGAARVFVNSSRLNASEFTASNGTTVILGAAVDGGDVVEIETFYVNGVLDVAPLGHTHSVADFGITAAIQTKTWVLTADQSAFEMLDPFLNIDIFVMGSLVVQGVDYTVAGKIATFSPPIPAGATVTARAVNVPLSIPSAYLKGESDAQAAALTVSRADAAANHEFYGRYYGGA